MARTTASSRTTKSASAKKTTTSPRRTKSSAATTTKKQTQTKAKSTAAPRKRTTAAKTTAPKPKVAKTVIAADPVQPPTPAPERDVLANVEKLSAQLGTAIETLAELSSARSQPTDNTVRTLPTDRAAATFQRLVNDAVDDRVGQMLPPLITLRNELAQQADSSDAAGNGMAERGRQTLDHVLSLADVTAYTPRVGEPYDPLIHLAVDEVTVEGLDLGAVAEALQSGFRTPRGKVLVPAKVKINGG